MHAANDGRPIDRAAMIEAASRSLRQQMGRSRDRPSSKGSGSFYDAHASMLAAGGSDPRTSGEPRSAENAQRRIRSAENEHRIVHTQQPAHGGGAPDGGPSTAILQPSSALDHYPVEEEHPQHLGFEHVSQFGDIRRPFSRKKDPSASAAAGLGAFSSPVKMTDAFEQRKTRQPIPVESWGPRPPSRHGSSSRATTGLDSSPLKEERDRPSSTTSNSRSRSDANMGTSNGVGGKQAWGTSNGDGTWAAARYAPMHDPRRGREGKAKDRRSPAEELGVFGHGGSTNSFPPGRSQSSTKLTKSFSGAFAQESEPLTRPTSFVSGGFGQGSGAWASHVDSGNGGLEVSGLSLGDPAARAWPSSPMAAAALARPGSSSGVSPPTRRGSRASENVSVEDAEADADLSVHAYAFRRDTAPPQVSISRSSQQKSRGDTPTSQQRKDRGEARRGRDNRPTASRRTPDGSRLDPDFLSLFAS